MPDTKKLGEVLVESGIIDDFQLSSALSHQRNWGGKLGTVLIDLDFAREEDISRVMAELLKIPYINLFEPEIEKGVIRIIRADIAKKYGVVPVRKERGGELLLAMSDPLDISLIDEIRFITGLNIKPTIAMESEIQDAIRKYYDGVEVVRNKTASHLYRRTHSSDWKEEIIRGYDFTVPHSDAKSPVPSKEETAQLQDFRTRLDAITTLLIEKRIISRDELVSMIHHKRMGL